METKSVQATRGVPVNTHDMFFYCRRCQRKMTEFDLQVNGELYKENKLICADCLIRTQEPPPWRKIDYLWLFINYLFPFIFLAYLCYGFIVDPDWFYLFRDIFLYYIPLGTWAVVLGTVIDFILFPISTISLLIAIIASLPDLINIFKELEPEEETYTSRSIRIGETLSGSLVGWVETKKWTGRNPFLMLFAIVVPIILAVLKIALGGVIFLGMYIYYSIETHLWKKKANLPLIKGYKEILKLEELENRNRRRRNGRKYFNRAEQLKRQYSYLEGAELTAKVSEELRRAGIEYPYLQIHTDESAYEVIGATGEGENELFLIVDKSTSKWYIIYANRRTMECCWQNKRGSLLHKIYIRDKNMSLTQIRNLFPWQAC